MNRLALETSPYLLQHANNPVNWYPWGDEALQKALLEDKPILISIGYSACHWCHVMERESFENESVAELMNNYFVNIKIDREERPDLDHIYMDAVQSMSGGGGWPLNVFLTPDCKPFYGGTYFPPVRAYNRASWKEVLTGIHHSFKTKRLEIEQQANQLVQHLQKTNFFGLDTGSSNSREIDQLSKSQLQQAYNNIMQQADKQWGGFGGAPKFPQTFTIQWLISYNYFTGDVDALKQGCLSIDKMIMGGLYDHIAGGFERYSTDREWLVPHFEKMLYDNALLVIAIAEAFQVTKNPIYEQTIRKTLQFVVEELTDENGAFYSALDADSEGVEGKYYVWTYEEVTSILEDDAVWFCSLYDITPSGNWEDVNILRLNAFPLENSLYNKQKIDVCLQKLKEARSLRIKPQLDDKIILGWNALMSQAFIKAAMVLNDEVYLQVAIKNIAFLQKNMVINENGSARHTYKAGIAKFDAFLDDYANLIKALLDLQEITGNPKYLIDAKTTTEYVIENFSDEEQIYFYYTHQEQKDVIVRKKEIYDGAVPSGNAIMAKNIWYLSKIFDSNLYEERVKKMLNGLLKVTVSYPTSFGNWASILFNLVHGSWEIVVDGTNYKPVSRKLLMEFIPNKVFQQALPFENQYPMLIGKNCNFDTTIHYCLNKVCGIPVDQIEKLLINIKKKC
jgi:hypothetical protein